MASFYTRPKQGLNRAQTGPKHGDLSSQGRVFPLLAPALEKRIANAWFEFKENVQTCAYLKKFSGLLSGKTGAVWSLFPKKITDGDKAQENGHYR